jgi:uncharacterized membrane-anchored protein
VPEVTALFWIIKITSTATGESLSDFLDGPSNVVIAGVGALISAALFVYALRRQFGTRRYSTWTYWFAVAMVATFGTMAADSLHQFLDVPYGIVTAFYAVVLGLVFWRWWANEGTLSIHSITTRRRERFYWATVLATFALGTAAGDWTAGDLHLGFFSSALMFTAAIVVPLLAYRLGANSIVTFWTAYVLTRPLGASYADWFDYPRSAGGLGVHRLFVWSAPALVMAALVALLARRERDPDSSAAPHEHVEAEALGADEHHRPLHPDVRSQDAQHGILHPRPELAAE